MRLFSLLVMLSAIVISSGSALAQTSISDLQTELQSGRIAVEVMRGNGSSSGMAIEGKIRNTSPRTIRINTDLLRPMYLGNRTSRSRQNMIAFSLYERGGRFYTQGNNSFIEVPPNQSTDVDLIAYCADFEKDNPSSADQFDISEVPPEISGITQKIAQYKRRNPKVDVTIAAQVALWLVQGHSAEEISTTFQFSTQDELKAREIINQ